MSNTSKKSGDKHRDADREPSQSGDQPWAMLDADERLEFALSQYLDGDLHGQELADLERRLAGDNALAGRLAAYRRFDDGVRSGVAEVPELDWDRFAMQAADRRDAHDAARRARTIYRLFAPLAAAAAVIGIAVFWSGRVGTDGGRTRPLEVAQLGVDVEQAAAVEVERALPWQMIDQPTATVAKVRFDRSVPPGFTPPGADETIASSIVIASAGITAVDGLNSDEGTMPYF